MRSCWYSDGAGALLRRKADAVAVAGREANAVVVFRPGAEAVAVAEWDA